MFQKLREAALAYQLERQLVEGQDPHRVPELDLLRRGRLRDRGGRQDVLRLQPSRLRRRGNRCASAARPRGGGAARRDDLLADAPTRRAPIPEAATARRNHVLDEHGRAGHARRGEYGPAATHGAGPDAEPDPPSRGELRGPVLHRWLRQQVVDRYGAGEAFGGGLQITVDARPRVPAAQSRSASRAACRRSSRPASAVVIDNKTGGVLAMVGGFDFEKEPFNLATNGHRQPGSSFKPFTLVDGAPAGPLARARCSPRRRRDPVPGQDPGKATARRSSTRSSRSTTTRTTTSGSASIATATTYSDNSVYASSAPRSGPPTSPPTAIALGSDRPLDRDRVLDRRRAVRALQPRVDPRRARDRRHAAGDGLRVLDARPQRRAHRRDDGQRARQGARAGRDREGRRRRGASRSPSTTDDSGSSGENEVQTEQVLDETAADTAVDAARRPSSPSGTGKNAADRRLRVGQDGHDRRQRRRLVLRRHRGHHRVRLGRPPRQRHADGDRVRGRARRRRHLSRPLIWHDIVHAYDSIIGSDDEERRRLRRAATATRRPLRSLRRPRRPTDDGRARPPTEPAAPAERGARRHRQPRAAGGGAPGRRHGHRRRQPRRASGSLASTARSGRERNAAAGGAEAPRVVDRARDPDPRPGLTTSTPLAARPPAPSSSNGGRSSAAPVLRRGRSRAPRSACPGPSTARASRSARGARRISLDPPQRLERPDQHRGGVALRLGDRVEQAVDAVGEVDVGAAGRAEEHLVARRAARRRRGRRGRSRRSSRSRRSRRRRRRSSSAQPTRSAATSCTERCEERALERLAVGSVRAGRGAAREPRRRSSVAPRAPLGSASCSATRGGRRPAGRALRLERALGAQHLVVLVVEQVRERGELVARRCSDSGAPRRARGGRARRRRRAPRGTASRAARAGRRPRSRPPSRRPAASASRSRSKLEPAQQARRRPRGTARWCRRRRTAPPCPPACPSSSRAAARAARRQGRAGGDDPRRLGAQQLGGVGVLLLRHDARARGEVLGGLAERELVGSTTARSRRRAGTGARRRSRPRRGSRARSRGSRRRRSSSASTDVEAELARRPPRGRAPS